MRKEYKIWSDSTSQRIVYIVSVVILIILCRYAFCSFSVNGVYYPSKTSVEYSQIPIEAGTEVGQEFICRGKGLISLNFFIAECHENSGFVNVKLEDKSGNSVMEPMTYDLGAYNATNLVLPILLDSELKQGEEYIIKLSFFQIDEKNPPSIKVCNISGIGEKLCINESKKTGSLYVEYNYENYILIENMIYSIMLILASVFVITVVSYIRLNICEKWLRAGKEILLVVLAIGNTIVINYLNGGLSYFSIEYLLGNAVPLYIFGRIIFAVIQSIPITEIIVGTFSFIVSIVNYFVCLYRGRPIGPWDLKAISTAATVADKYEYTLSMDMVWVFIILMFLCQLSFILKVDKKVIDKRYVISECKLIIFCIMMYSIGIIPTIKVSAWSPTDVYKQEGIVAGFLGYIEYMNYEKPREYSDERCEQFLDEVEIRTSDETKVSAQNIIVIMNESFTDFNAISEGMMVENYTPFINSLTENTIKGNLYVPVYGAGTCNSEFEVLTGVSCVNFVSGFTPYQMSITKKTDSLATVLKDEGYETIAFHPYYEKNWNRDKVYSYLGFDDFISIEDMDELQEGDKVGVFTTDECNYRYIIDEYENKESDKFFMFNVTVQNHGGYDNLENAYETTVDLSKYGEFPQAENYFSQLSHQ